MRSRIDTEATRTFNDRRTAADFVEWLNVDSWSVEEAVALSLGRDPSKVDWESEIAPYTEISRVAKEFARRLGYLERAVSAGVLSARIPPKRFVEWALGKGFTMPSVLCRFGGRGDIPNESIHGKSAQLSFLEALHEILGITAEFAPEVVTDKSAANSVPADDAAQLSPRISLSVSENAKASRTLREFRDIAVSLELNLASHAKWLEIAEWYCFAVVSKDTKGIYRRDDGRHLAQWTSDETCLPPVIEGEALGWVIRARERAFLLMKEASREDAANCTQEKIAKAVCSDTSAPLLSKLKKTVKYKYVIRRAFTQDKWWKLATKQLGISRRRHA